MIYRDASICIDTDDIVALYDYTIYLRSVCVDVRDPLGLVNYWSAIDPACLVLVRTDNTLVLDIQSILFASKDQVILEGDIEVVQFLLEPGEFEKIAECRLAVAEMIDNETYGDEIAWRVEEYRQRNTLALPPAPKDEVVEANRTFLIDKFGHLFDGSEDES